jgi:hypothetical protein
MRLANELAAMIVKTPVTPAARRVENASLNGQVLMVGTITPTFQFSGRVSMPELIVTKM